MEMVIIVIIVGFLNTSDIFRTSLGQWAYISLVLKCKSLYCVVWDICIKYFNIIHLEGYWGRKWDCMIETLKSNHKACCVWYLGPYLYTRIVQIAFLDAINTTKVIQPILEWRQLYCFSVPLGVVIIFLWKTIIALEKN